MSLGCDPTAAGQGLRTSSATQLHELGARMVDSAGRVFRYVKAGGTALVAGFLQQSPAVVTTHQACAVGAAGAIGDKTLTITLGATNAATANQYAGGFATVSVGTGIGYAYRIKSHPAADAAASLVLTLDEPLIAAVATSDSKVDLTANPYNGVIITPATTLTGIPVGVAIYPIAANEYGWLQTHGPAPCSVEGTPAVGTLLAAQTDTAGQLVAFSTVLPPVGYTLQAGADEAVKQVFLTLD